MITINLELAEDSNVKLKVTGKDFVDCRTQAMKFLKDWKNNNKKNTPDIFYFTDIQEIGPIKKC
jgi:hypothetical protein